MTLPHQLPLYPLYPFSLPSFPPINTLLFPHTPSHRQLWLPFNGAQKSSYSLSTNLPLLEPQVSNHSYSGIRNKTSRNLRLRDASEAPFHHNTNTKTLCCLHHRIFVLSTVASVLHSCQVRSCRVYVQTRDWRHRFTSGLLTFPFSRLRFSPSQL